ncbi:glycosyltransferase [Gammaproteobacteria bacterium]|nr:glycosyltransferase [Gammaproteobacteria bacterium]MDC0914550.1 glycosyltransferase [Gammaproteobacteria bacterium]
MKQKNIKISVILSIFGNDGNLLKTLTCLSDQVRVPDELVIVNSLHKIEIDKIKEQFKDRLKINYFFSETRLMPGGSRNLGLLKARFPVAAFIDSKTFPVKSWLEDSLKQLQSSKASIIFGTTQYKAHSEIQNIFILSTYGKNPVMSVPGTVLLKNIAQDLGEFDATVRAGEDLEWKDRIEHSKTIKAQQSLEVNMFYNITSNNIFQEFIRSARNSWASSTINAQLNTRILIFGLSSLSLMMITPYWNRFLGGFIFIPNVTKIYILTMMVFLVGLYLTNPKNFKYFSTFFFIPLVVILFLLQYFNPALLSITLGDEFEVKNLNYFFFIGLFIIGFAFRAFIAPLRLGAQWKELMPIRWIYMGFFGLINDVVKVPGYLRGAILSLRLIMKK